MGYPYNYGVEFDDYFSASDAPIAISEIEALLVKHKEQLARTMLSSIEAILVAQYGSAAKIEDEKWFAELAASLGDTIAESLSFFTESKSFEDYIKGLNQ